ncbi:MAG: hypothetical protein JWO60_3132 [Frankiales bacterium]|nr:hypothetical protein [Frankiales bacterium]
MSGGVVPGFADDRLDRYYDPGRAQEYGRRRFETEKSLVLARSALELLRSRLVEQSQAIEEPAGA